MTRSLPKPPKTVDLHADVFIDNLDDYDVDELLVASLDRLREMLDAAIYWEYAEIKFIHGKGKGVLKKAVYEELKHYRDAGLINKYQPSYHNDDVVVVHIGL